MAHGFLARVIERSPDLLGRVPHLTAGLAVSLSTIDSAAVGILGLGLVLRVMSPQSSVWFDEAHSLAVASQPTIPLLLEGVVHDLQSPLYFLLLHMWLQWLQSDFGVRLLSVIFGFISLYLVYRLGAALFTADVGRLAALFMAVSSYHIYYSQYVRAYILLAVLALSGALTLLWALRRGGWGWWALHTVSVVAALYTQPYAVFVLFGYFPPSLYYIGRHRRSAWRPWLISHLVIAASQGPWLAAALWQFAQVQKGSDPWITPISIHALQSLWGSLWWMSRDDFGLWPGIVFRAAWGALALVLGFGAIARFRQWEHWFLLSFLLLPPLLVLIASLGGSQSIWSPRYFVFLCGPFAVLLALGVVNLPHERLRTGAIALYLLLSLPVVYTLQNHATFKNPDVRAAAEWARIRFQRGDVIVHTNEQSYLPAIWYDRLSAAHGPDAPYRVDCVLRSMPQAWCEAQSYPQLYLDRKWNDLPTLAWYADRIWLLALYDHRTPREDLVAEGMVDRLIGRDYQVQERADFLGVRAFLLLPAAR